MATRSVFAHISDKNRAAVTERQLDSLRAGTHELYKQTETNWNTFFQQLFVWLVMLSHKQRNDLCTVVSVHLLSKVT